VKLYPAIDIRDGNCVRLYQGDYDRETVYGDNPADQAALFADEGAEWIHCVDLDAARSGDQQNLPSIAAVAERIGVPMQVGGGSLSAPRRSRIPNWSENWLRKARSPLASTHGAPTSPSPAGNSAPARTCSKPWPRSPMPGWLRSS